MDFLTLSCLSTTALAGAILVAFALGYGMRPKNCPPGPPTLPIIGNLHLMPHTNIHLRLQEWAKKYGPIMSLKFGTQDMIVLNEDRIVRELIDKRSGIYSGRMDMFITEFGKDQNILMNDNHEIWRRQRKMYHLRLNSNVADRYLHYQNFETVNFLHDILDSPDDFQEHVKRFTTSLGSTIMYGWRTTSVDQPHIKSMFMWIAGFSVAVGRLQVMDWWPGLRHIFRLAPSWITGISKEMKRLQALEEDTWMKLFLEAKSAIQRGSQRASFCADMILNNKEGSEDYISDKIIAANAGHGFAGATDTTLNTALGFIKAMMLYPEVQARAQKEIDRVIGSGRLPAWDDLDSLPYIRCLMKETFRWMPTTILGGMPHRLARDDHYGNYFLPANAGIMINVWTINNDERRVRNPRTFDPSRYEGDLTSTAESAALGDATKRDHFNFGAGRRICPGIYVAERSIFIFIARLLWAFSMSRPVGSDGKPFPVNPDAITPGFIVSPVPYKCVFTPRDGKRAAVIKEWDRCLQFLDGTGDYKEDFFNNFSP